MTQAIEILGLSLGVLGTLLAIAVGIYLLRLSALKISGSKPYSAVYTINSMKWSSNELTYTLTINVSQVRKNDTSSKKKVLREVSQYDNQYAYCQ